MKKLTSLIIVVCMLCVMLPCSAEVAPVLNKRQFDFIGESYLEISEKYGTPIYSYYWEGNSCFAFYDGKAEYLLFFDEQIINGDGTDVVGYDDPAFKEPNEASFCTGIVLEVNQLFGGEDGVVYSLEDIAKAMDIAVPKVEHSLMDDVDAAYFKYGNLSIFADYVTEGKNVTDGYSFFFVKKESGRYFADPEQTVRVFIDGIEIMFDQPPILENDRTLAPVRFIFTALGYDVNWDEDTETVYAAKGTDSIILKIDDTTAYVNGEAKILDVPARLVNDRTLVPLRFISENSDAMVDWNGFRNFVEITTEQAE